MEAYFERFGGVRDYLRDVVDAGPAGPATPRRSSAAGATCPTSPATTGSAARWPSGWRSTRRSRARPPTSSRSRCSASTAALREAGLRSRLLLQVHDELVLEVAPGERERGRGSWSAREMGGAYPLAVAARRLRRRRPHLGRRRALTGEHTGVLQDCAGDRARRGGLAVGAAAVVLLVAACGSEPALAVPGGHDPVQRDHRADQELRPGHLHGHDRRRQVRDRAATTWNGTLLLYSHGYRQAEAAPPDFAPVADRRRSRRADGDRGRDALLAQGYALAGSAYATNGWAVADGVKADEDLYDFFVRGGRHAQPHVRLGRQPRRPHHPDGGPEAPGVGVRRGPAVRRARRHQPQRRPVPGRGVRGEDAAGPGPEARRVHLVRRGDGELRAGPKAVLAATDSTTPAWARSCCWPRWSTRRARPRTTTARPSSPAAARCAEAILTALGFGTTVRHDIEQRVGGNPSDNRTRTTPPASRPPSGR